jgi:hypothetical protein
VHAVRSDIEREHAQRHGQPRLRASSVDEHTNAQEELSQAERLTHEVVGSRLETLDAILLSGSGRHHDDGDGARGRVRLQGATHVDAQSVGKFEIQEDGFRLSRASKLQNLDSEREIQHVVPGVLQARPQELSIVRFVIDDENERHVSRVGSMRDALESGDLSKARAEPVGVEERTPNAVVAASRRMLATWSGATGLLFGKFPTRRGNFSESPSVRVPSRTRTVARGVSPRSCSRSSW